MYSDYAIADPLRSPAWRYERACEIVNQPGTRFSSRSDDETTREVVKFLTARRALSRSVRNNRQRDMRLQAQFPHLSVAHRIFELTTQELPRIVLESRLLANQDFAEIGASLAMSPVAVHIYHDVYFHVRDRLDSLDYIASTVIGPVFQSGIDDYSPELLLKYFAYFGGPKLIQMILYGFQGVVHPASDADLLAFLDAKVSDNIRTQALIATTLMRPSRLDVRTLVEGYTSIMALQQKLQGVDEQSDWVSSLVKELQKTLKAPRGNDALEFVKNRKGSYSVGSVELRASEQMALAQGQSLPNLEQLASFQKPQPTSAISVQNSLTTAPKGSN